MILAIVAAIVFPHLAPKTGPGRLKAAAMQIAAILRTDRTAAMRTGRATTTSIDLSRREIRSGEMPSTMGLPNDVDLTVDYAARETLPSVRFFPNGSSSGARLRITSRVAAYEIRVDWFTGAVRVEVPHAR